MRLVAGRWLAIALAVIGVALIELLSDSVLDPVLPFPLDTILVTGVVLCVATAAGLIAFRSIDALTHAVHDRNEELERLNASAAALHQVTIAIAALGDIDRILGASVDHARVLLRADAAVLALTGPDDTIVVRATNAEPGALTDIAGIAPGAEAGAFFEPTVRTSLLVSALQYGGRTLGWLAVGSRVEQVYGVGDLETLGSLAGQAAIALEQDRLQQELRQLAVRRERERIARDLHDGIAQVLGYVNTKSQAVEQLLNAGRVTDAMDQLSDLASTARSVYVDVRSAIAGLSVPAPIDEPFPDAIAAASSRWAESAKVAVEVRADAASASLRLASAQDDQVLAIVREALTNVQKHASARRVQIALAVTDGVLAVSVADDGRGFDPAAPDVPRDWPHYGRVGMSDRAAAIGGTVEWDASPGRGTTVRIRVPIAVAPRVSV